MQAVVVFMFVYRVPRSLTLFSAQKAGLIMLCETGDNYTDRDGSLLFVVTKSVLNTWLEHFETMLITLLHLSLTFTGCGGFHLIY